MRTRWVGAVLAVLLLTCGTSFGGYYVIAYDDCGRPYRRYVSTPAPKGRFNNLTQVQNGQRVHLTPAQRARQPLLQRRSRASGLHPRQHHAPADHPAMPRLLPLRL